MTSKSLTFQPGKFTSTLANNQQNKRKKKKAFGRRNNNTKVQSILASTNKNKNTNKRIPMEIGIKEKKQNITPKEQLLVGSRQQNTMNNNNTGISKGGMSSITAPTALKGGYSNRYTLATAATTNHDAVVNDGDELSFNEEEEYDTTNNNTKKKNNNALASTRKRLSYGMGEERIVSNNNKNNAALVGKKKGNKKNKDEDKSKLVKKQQGEHSKKRSRSGELRRMSKSAGQSTTAAKKDGRDKKRGQTSIQQKTIITTKNPFTKKSQRTSSSYAQPLPTKKSIIVRTKSSSHNVHIPSGSNNNKLNQRELLKLAKSNNGTVIQYHATLHYGDSITDKNFSSSSSSSNKLSSTNDYLIENGDLVIQQDCANVKGTYWTTKFGFRHWKLPGVRSSRGVSIYSSTRPILADDKDSGASGDKKKKRPLLTLDTSLSTQHDRLVRRFVKEARAGQTPFDFFPENELDGDKEGDDWQCKDEGNFGGVGDGFSFNDDGLAPSSDEKSAEEQEEEDEEDDQRPAKRKAFGDRSNTVPRVHVPQPTQKTKTITKPRTKSARKKRKSSDTQATLPSTASSSCSSKKRPRTSIQFSVPSFDQEEGGGYQDQVHWGLIEGMGGGEEESENSSLPHRGRILEIPGVVMSGKWETNLLYDNVGEEDEDGELNSLRLSLRHNTASSCSLETYYTGKEDSPNGLTVSLLDTSSNRVDDFVKQGVLSEDEVDFCVDGGKVTNDSFLSCLSLVTFGGFMSSSAATNEANKMTRSLLAGCTNGRRASQNGLHKIVGGEHDETDLGVLFPCKLGFDNKYSFLIQHDAKFRVTAIDVIFRQLEASPQNTGLTTTMLSDHQADVGSGSGLIMERFMEYPFKRNYQLPGTIIEKDKVQKKSRLPTNKAEEASTNDDDEEEVVSPQKPVDEATDHVSSAEDEGDAEEQETSAASVESKEHAGSDDLSVTSSHDKDQDANEQEEAKVVNPPSSIGDDEKPNISDEVRSSEHARGSKKEAEEEEMSFGGGDRDPFDLDEPESQAEKVNKVVDKQDDQRPNKDDEIGADHIKNDGTLIDKPPSPIDQDQAQQTEAEQSNKGRRKKLLTAETLTAAYEDFERNRKTTQISSVGNTINSNSQPLVVLEDSGGGSNNNQNSHRLSSRMSVSDWRRSFKNRKVVIVEDDIIDESLLGPRPGGTNDHRRRRNSTGNVGLLHKATKNTATRKNRHSLPAVTTTKPSVKKLPAAVSTSKHSHMKKKPLRREVTLEAVEAPKSAPQVRKTKSILKKSNRRASHEPAISKSNAVSSSSSVKNRRVSLNLKPLVKPTKVNDVDLLDDSNSLFGCGVRSYAKTPNARKSNNSRLLKKYSSRKKFGSGVSHTPSHKGKSNESDTMRSSIEQKKVVQSSSRDKRRTSLRSVNTSRGSKSHSATRSQRDEATLVDPQKNQGEHESVISTKQKEVHDALLDDMSVHSTGGSFHCEEETVISPTPSDTESFTQPLHDVYFGHDGSNQSASQSTSSLIDACVDNEDAQNFHDSFYGQEVINGEEADHSNGQPLHDVFYGLDSNDSLPELEFTSLADQEESSTTQFYDSYFGKEPPSLVEDESEEEAEVVMMTRSPKRCVMQSNRLLVGVLLALWVQASY